MKMMQAMPGAAGFSEKTTSTLPDALPSPPQVHQPMV
jgi:hypothetical protein